MNVSDVTFKELLEGALKEKEVGGARIYATIINPKMYCMKLGGKLNASFYKILTLPLIVL